MVDLVQKEALQVDPAVKICGSSLLRKRCELFMMAAVSQMWRIKDKAALLKLKWLLITMLLHILWFDGYSEPETVAGVNLRGNRPDLRWETGAR